MPNVSTLLISDPIFQTHETPRGHPERVDRIRAVESALESEKFAYLQRETARRGTAQEILRVHPQSHIFSLEAASPTHDLVHIDADTVMSPGTLEAAFRAVGAATQAVESVFEGRHRNVFVASRPPGHHAETKTAMGFCFFNNAAIAARHAQAKYGAERIAIIDWDVHHGNGTQEIFWNDKNVLYASTHQMPLYPGSGAETETGAHDTIHNVPLREGDGSEVFRDAMEHLILPRVSAFRPDFIIISAGFDAHHLDPLGGLRLEEHDFTWATEELMNIAALQCNGRLVSLLEGGYDLNGLARSAAAHVQTLMTA